MSTSHSSDQADRAIAFRQRVWSLCVSAEGDITREEIAGSLGAVAAVYDHGADESSGDVDGHLCDFRTSVLSAAAAAREAGLGSWWIGQVLGLLSGDYVFLRGCEDEAGKW